MRSNASCADLGNMVAVNPKKKKFRGMSEFESVIKQTSQSLEAAFKKLVCHKLLLLYISLLGFNSNCHNVASNTSCR